MLLEIGGLKYLIPTGEKYTNEKSKAIASLLITLENLSIKKIPPHFILEIIYRLPLFFQTDILSHIWYTGKNLSAVHVSARIKAQYK
ncbi:unnamed protein product [marine sediment metagenome]|uniref:Uncharacterized protein n=1 Tax=marine sediment metagenome TaxID=412755 RepID=X1IC41_9ZZZZ